MDPVIANINYTANGDFSRYFAFADTAGNAYNFTGSTFKCEVRPAPGSGTLTKSLTSALITTDIANGRIGIVWAKGDIPIGTWYYDLLMVTSGKQVPILQGTITIAAGVTT